MGPELFDPAHPSARSNTLPVPDFFGYSNQPRYEDSDDYSMHEEPYQQKAESSIEPASDDIEIPQGIIATKAKFSATLEDSKTAMYLIGNVQDRGLAMGRSFRVGWGPNGVLAVPRGNGLPDLFQHVQVTQSKIQEGEVI